MGRFGRFLSVVQLYGMAVNRAFHSAEYAGRNSSPIFLALLISGVCLSLRAGEIRSNGRGGGPWTDRASWQENAVPTMNDVVTIVGDDTIVFDGNCEDKPSCMKLLIAPKGALTYKADGCRHTLTVAGPIEVWGSVLMDGRQWPAGLMELRLVSKKDDDRLIHFYTNSSFTAWGAGGLPDGRRNVVICTGPPEPRKPRLQAKVVVDSGAWYSFRYVWLSHSGEYHSNGVGGGRWTDPETWKGNIVPGQADVVVIATGDTVSFDGNDKDKPTCRKILIDPDGVLEFRADGAEHVLSVAGPVELYGQIRMNGAKSPDGLLELRIIAEEAGQRKICLLRNSKLLAYGAEGLSENRRNVVISAGVFDIGYARQTASLEASIGVMLDLHYVRLFDMVVSASSIDNTGFKPNERLNIVGNHFAGFARLALEGCDTPAVYKNMFEYSDGGWLDSAAIYAVRCKLAAFRGNRIAGRYRIGIETYDDIDSSAVGNTVSKAATGLYWHGKNAMIKNNVIEECDVGIHADSTTGALEDMTIRRPKTAVNLAKCNLQLTDFRIEELPTNEVAMKVDESSVTLLNCNITHDRIKSQPGQSTIECMQYLIVGVKGECPPGTYVEVHTAADSGGPPQRGADLNVRNSPATLAQNGMTPLPYTLQPLVVRSWRSGGNGEKVGAPFYDLIVLAPAEEQGKPLRVLKKMIIEPKDDWFRSEPNKPTAGLEVQLP